MDRTEAKAIIDHALPHMRWALQIQDWEITVAFGRVAGGNGRLSCGEVNVLAEYRRARITIDHEAADNTDDILRTLRHELLHIVLGPYEAYRVQANEGLYDNVRALLENTWHDSSERAIGNLERMLDWGVCVKAQDMDRTRTALVSATSQAASALEWAGWSIVDAATNGQQPSQESIDALRKALEGWRDARGQTGSATVEGG